jgi:hypothetical protein
VAIFFNVAFGFTWLARAPAVLSVSGVISLSIKCFTAFLARLGIVRLFRPGSAIYAGLPERPAAEMRAILAQPQAWSTSGNVLLIWNEPRTFGV